MLYCQTVCVSSLMLWITLGAASMSSGQTREAGDPQAFTILAWNIEFGGSEIATIKEQLLALEPYDILALSEVPKKAVNDFAERWGKDALFVGTKGGEASLVLAWNAKKFDKLSTLELIEFENQEFAPGIQSAPLIAQLRCLPSQTEFIVVMNHLTRGSEELRKRQALILVAWAKQQTLPIIAVGGYNFDYDIPTKKGNAAFDAFLSDGTWKWIEPVPLSDTNWADRNRDGQDDYPDSMLDFAFAAGPAKQWDLKSEVIIRKGDFPDDAKTSDQRPMRTEVKPKSGQ